MVDGELRPDPQARLPGRGAYTCRTQACFERARQRGGFNRALRRAVRVPALGIEENVHLEAR